MRKLIGFTLFLLICGNIFALTGFGESNTFGITETTLPVELSSFTAIATAQNSVQLQWTTQSEANLLGYYLYRANTSVITSAIEISDLIQPTNTSSQQSYHYTDAELIHSGTYYYWLYALETNGTGSYHGPLAVSVNLDGNPETPGIPLATGLSAIYPNPFNPSATIAYQLRSPENVRICIYNSKGQVVRTIQRSHGDAGYYSEVFNGLDDSGNDVSSGVYYVVMKAGKHLSTKKIVLMK